MQWWDREAEGGQICVTSFMKGHKTSINRVMIRTFLSNLKKSQSLHCRPTTNEMKIARPNYKSLLLVHGSVGSTLASVLTGCWFNYPAGAQFIFVTRICTR